MTAPTWQELREAAWVVCDGENRHLAIYPDAGGHVVVALRDGSGRLHRVALRFHDVAALGHTVKRACDIAGTIGAGHGARAAMVATQEAIGRMKGSP